MKKRILSSFLAVIMLFSYLPAASAFAEEAGTAENETLYETTAEGQETVPTEESGEEQLPKTEIGATDELEDEKGVNEQEKTPNGESTEGDGTFVVSSEKTVLEVGESIQLQLIRENEDEMDGAIIWTSSDENVAVVDGDGLVTAVAAGTVEISATSETYSATVTLIVYAAPAQPVDGEQTGDIDPTENKEDAKGEESTKKTSGIAIAHVEQAELVEGETLQLEVVCVDDEVADLTAVIWTSSNEECVTVDKDGLVTAVMTGEAEITAALGEYSDTVKLTVFKKEAEVPFLGKGTAEDPWQIASEGDLAAVAALVNGTAKSENVDENSPDEMNFAGAYYVLTDDITFSTAWTPIGTAEKPFTGSFNGCGRKLEGLTAGSVEYYFGLFGVTENAVISRMVLDNVSIQTAGCEGTAAIVGLMRGGTLTESYVTGYVSGGSGATGGLVGMLDGGVVENSYNTAEIYGYEIAGGVVGSACGGAVISCCYGSGRMTTAVWRKLVGYVVGEVNGADVLSSYSIGGVDYYGYIVDETISAYEESYQGFDFDSVWSIAYSRPCLINNTELSCSPTVSTVTNGSSVHRALLIGQQTYTPSNQVRPGGLTTGIFYNILDNTSSNWNTTAYCDVTASETLYLIDSVFSASSAGDINLFYFCGHGVESGSAAGSLCAYDDTLIWSDQLANALASKKGHCYVIIDTCGSGGVIATNSAGDSGDPVSFNQGLIDAFEEIDSRYVRNSGEMRNSKFSVLTACGKYEYSYSSMFNGDNTYGWFEFTKELSGAGGEPAALNSEQKMVQYKTEFLADTNRDNMVTFYEAYVYTYNAIISKFSDSHVQLYPSGCSDVLFYRTGTPPAKPNVTTPTLKAAGAPGFIKLSWNDVSGVYGYWIYRSTDGNTYNFYDICEKNEYYDSSVYTGTRYYYKVRPYAAINGIGYGGDYSAAKSAVATSRLTRPILNISKGDGTVKLNWGSVASATSYWIYRSTDGSNFDYYASTTGTSYSDSSVTGGVRYYYRVLAIAEVDGAYFASDYSETKSTVPLATPKLSISKSSGKVKLSWNVVTGASKYWIYRSTDGKNFKYYDTITGTTYTNNSVTSGIRYYYRVKAIATVDDTDWTSDLSAIKSTVPVKTPTLSIAKSDGKVKLSWSAVTGASKYWIYRSTDGKSFKYYDATSGTTYTNSSVTSGVRYYYRVKAVTTINGVDWTGDLSAVKNTVPVATPKLSISKSSGKANLNWSAVTGASKYWVYRSTDGVNYSYYSTTSKTSYTVSVNSGTKYYYKVKAVATVDGSDWTGNLSNTVS